MVDKPILFLNLPGRPPMAFVEAMPDWDDFDKLIKFLMNRYDAEILERIDGPDARRWVLKIKQEVFELWHDDVAGNSIVAVKPSAEPLVREIAEDLEEKLNADGSISG